MEKLIRKITVMARFTLGNRRLEFQIKPTTYCVRRNTTSQEIAADFTVQFKDMPVTPALLTAAVVEFQCLWLKVKSFEWDSGHVRISATSDTAGPMTKRQARVWVFGSAKRGPS